jgi:hypothetical protein
VPNQGLGDGGKQLPMKKPSHDRDSSGPNDAKQRGLHDKHDSGVHQLRCTAPPLPVRRERQCRRVVMD